MNRYPSTQKNQRKTTADNTGGGFSLIIFSPMVLFLGMLWLLFQIDKPESTSSMYLPTSISIIFTPEVQQWESMIIEWAMDYLLHPNLIATVMQIESCGNPKALSPAGAMGIFQVMPYHFEIGESSYHPETNAFRGLSFLKLNLERFGSVKLALAAYNGGPSNAVNPSYSWPQETKDYVYWGENIYEESVSGETTSQTLQAWLNAGGSSLCTQSRNQ